MGNKFSHIIDTLHPIPSEERTIQLRMLLADHELCSGLIEESKSAELNVSLRPLSKRKPRVSSLLSLNHNPLIWKPDEEKIQSWSTDTSTFWRSSSWTATFNGQLANLYQSTLSLETRGGQDVLRFRFLYLFFYDLILHIYPEHGKKTPERTYQHITEIISGDGSIGHSSEEIGSRVKDWVSRGKRYHKLAKAFGDGILVELPVDVVRDTVERRLPIEDDTAFNEAVSGIAKLDLTENARRSGSRIRHSALEPFRFIQEDARTYVSSRRPLMRIFRGGRRDEGSNTGSVSGDCSTPSTQIAPQLDSPRRTKRPRLGQLSRGIDDALQGLAAAKNDNSHEYGCRLSTSSNDQATEGDETGIVETGDSSTPEVTQAVHDSSRAFVTNESGVPQHPPLRTRNNALDGHVSESPQLDMIPSTLPTKTQSTLQAIHLTRSVPTTAEFFSSDNSPISLESTVQTLQTNAMEIGQLQDCGTATTQNQQHLRTNTTGGDACQYFGHEDLASFLPSEPTHGAQPLFGPESQNAWGMDHAIAMPEEGNQHQGSWERAWAIEKAIPMLQQPQQMSVEKNNTVSVSQPLSWASELSLQSGPTMDYSNAVSPQVWTQDQLLVMQEWGLRHGVFLPQH